MRLSVLTLALASAGIAASTPLRVVVVSNSVHVGNAAEAGGPGPLAVFRPTIHNVDGNQRAAGRHGCGLLRDKTLEFTNKFREFFGFEPVHPVLHKHPAPLPPLPFIGTPIELPKEISDPDSLRAAQVPPNSKILNETNFVHILPVSDFDNAQIWQEHKQNHHRLRGSFVRRIHRALMSLGPWEGRAVAFVLGCGIGVLLRMFWVMAVVIFRAVRGGNSESNSLSDEFDSIVFVEELDVAPPAYHAEKRIEEVPADEKAQTN